MENSELRSSSEVIQPFSCSSSLSMELIVLINVKMSTIVGILTFMSMIVTRSERSESKTHFCFSAF